MKTKLAGLIYFVLASIISALLLLAFLGSLGLLASQGALSSPLVLVALGVQLSALGLMIFTAVWAFALRLHRKWAWYAGVVLIPIGIIGNVVKLVSGQTPGASEYMLYANIGGIALGAFTLYAIFAEKDLFMPGPIQPAEPNVPVPPAQPSQPSSL